jgi:hypothetical protein
VNDPQHEREHELETSDIRNEGVHHEEGDINVTPVYKFMFWLAIMVVFTYVLVYGIMKWNDGRVTKADQVVTHIPKSKNELLPPEPRLQLAPGHGIHPLAEGIVYRDSVMHALETYGYINKQSGLVHIPIDLAKDLLLQRGLAMRTNALSTPAAVMIPQFSSSGRTSVARDQRIPGGTFTVTGGNLNVREEQKAQ